MAVLYSWEEAIWQLWRPLGSNCSIWAAIKFRIILYRYNLLFIVMSILTRSRNAIFASVLTTLLFLENQFSLAYLFLYVVPGFLFITTN